MNFLDPHASGHLRFAGVTSTRAYDDIVNEGARAIARSSGLAVRMGSLIEATDGLILCAPVRLNVCCFSAAPSEWEGRAQDALNTKVRHQLQSSGDVVFSPITLNGRTVIRAAITDLCSETDIEFFISEVVRSRNTEMQLLSPHEGYHRARLSRLLCH